MYFGHYHLMYAEPYSDVHYNTFTTKKPGSFDLKKKKRTLSLLVDRCLASILDPLVGVSCLSDQPPAEREPVRTAAVTVLLPVCFIQ